MVYYFYFLLVGSRRNECNSLWGGIRGRGQKSTTYSENISVIKFYLSTLTLHLQWSIIFIFCVLAPEGMNSIVFGKDMRKGTEGCAYSDIISFFSSICYIFRASSSLLISPPYPSTKTIEFIPCEAKTQKIKIIDHCKCNVRASKNAEQAFSTQ